MKSKEDIVENWLPRYTGEKLENFGEYILLTNFSNYVEMFAKWNKVKVVGKIYSPKFSNFSPVYRGNQFSTISSFDFMCYKFICLGV